MTHPIYKQIKTLAPHCPKCKEQLRGNGSIASTYQCKCGEWQANKFPFNGEYEIIPKLYLPCLPETPQKRRGGKKLQPQEGLPAK